MRREVDEEFARYVRARQHQLLRAAYLVCGDARLAEDLVQRALVRLALRWDRERGGDPDVFVRRTLYRDAVASWRRSRRESLGIFPGEPVPAEGPGGAGERRVDPMGALLVLTPRQRAVVVLRYFEDRSEADTADVLGVSAATVRSQSEAAVARLRTVRPDLAATLTPGDDR